MAQTPVRFFELIRPNHNIDFVGKRKLLLWSSLLLVLVSLAFLPLNRYVFKGRGQFLNFSTDFRGGTSMLVQFNRSVSVEAVKQALREKGFADPEVFRSEKDTDSELNIRFLTVSALTPAQQAALKTAIQTKWQDQLERQDFRDSEDILYLWSKQPIDAADLRAVFQSVQIEPLFQELKNESKSDNTFSYRVPVANLEDQVRSAIEQKLGTGVVSAIPSKTAVGPMAGQEETSKGALSLIVAIGFILLYILIRFDFRYGPGTVIALLHDAVLVLGAFAITYKEFSATTIAAILTVIGYSMNDTIVVFDRIRENTTKYKDKRFRDIINLSVNETLSRTILTSATVFFVTLAMNLLGTGVIRDFGFAMNVGVIVGTYSSIFIASPILLWLNERFGKKTSNTPSKR